MEIMIKPIVTEKATATSEKLNCYTFRVSPDANKEQIKKLVQSMYGVKVVSVNTYNIDCKRKQHNTKSGLLIGRHTLHRRTYPRWPPHHSLRGRRSQAQISLNRL